VCLPEEALSLGALGDGLDQPAVRIDNQDAGSGLDEAAEEDPSAINCDGTILTGDRA
jgi:hypothetical protein